MVKFPSTGEILLGAVLAIVLLQLVGFVMGGALGFDFKAGPALVLIFMGLATWVAIRLVMGYWYSHSVDRAGIVLFVIVLGLVFAVSMFLPDYLPQIFEDGARSVQAAIAP